MRTRTQTSTAGAFLTEASSFIFFHLLSSSFIFFHLRSVSFIFVHILSCLPSSPPNGCAPFFVAQSAVVCSSGSSSDVESDIVRTTAQQLSCCNRAQPANQQRCLHYRTPTSRCPRRQIGKRYRAKLHGLSSNTMARITSDCLMQCGSLSNTMALITSGCVRQPPAWRSWRAPADARFKVPLPCSLRFASALRFPAFCSHGLVANCCPARFLAAHRRLIVHAENMDCHPT